uniref:Uncharacterized protein n=1 Tax=Triticum urartu TaxID=4572 RepID=A0A8R7R255_TRIUA
MVPWWCTMFLDLSELKVYSRLTNDSCSHIQRRHTEVKLAWSLFVVATDMVDAELELTLVPAYLYYYYYSMS